MLKALICHFKLPANHHMTRRNKIVPYQNRFGVFYCFWYYVSQHLSLSGQKNTLVYSIIICYPLITPIGRNLMALLLIPAAWHVSTTSVTFL